MFIGIDHGTVAIRFASEDGRCFEMQRKEASRLFPDEIIESIKQNLGCERVELVALTYSMGDGLKDIMRLEDAKNRGLTRQDGAGVHIGGGTRVFEAVRGSLWPAILLPGIHRESDVDPRLKVFSHGMSPEKVGLAYHVFRMGIESFIISDASSNTVTLAVLKGRIVGAIDATIFAPGLIQGPLDVEAIRNIDDGEITANEAFSVGGILAKMGKKTIDECDEEQRRYALETLSLFAAMEIGAMIVLLRDLGEPLPGLFLAGSPANLIHGRVSELLGICVQPLGPCAAAQGCAAIAKDVFAGAKSILGIDVDERAIMHS
jgi:putative methanogenesis marker protein 12